MGVLLIYNSFLMHLPVGLCNQVAAAALFFFFLNSCTKMSRGVAGKNGQENNSHGTAGLCVSADCTALRFHYVTRLLGFTPVVFHATDPQQCSAGFGGSSLSPPKRYSSPRHKGIHLSHHKHCIRFV